MRRTFNPECFDALVQLLERADPKDLPTRAHVFRCQGDPDRRTTRLPGILMGWLQRRHLERDVEGPLPSAIAAPRRHGRGVNRGLRILRPTGTD